MKRLDVIIFFVIVGILSWIAVPNVLTARNRSKQKRTMADVRTIATAWEARATDLNSYTVQPDRGDPTPKEAENFALLHRVDFADLERALSPTYIRKLPRVDGWGNAFDFRTGDYAAKGAAQMYALRSFGSDGKDDRAPYTGVPITKFKHDIAFANGVFIQFPEGT